MLPKAKIASTGPAAPGWPRSAANATVITSTDPKTPPAPTNVGTRTRIARTRRTEQPRLRCHLGAQQRPRYRTDDEDQLVEDGLEREGGGQARPAGEQR